MLIWWITFFKKVFSVGKSNLKHFIFINLINTKQCEHIVWSIFKSWKDLFKLANEVFENVFSFKVNVTVSFQKVRFLMWYSILYIFGRCTIITDSRWCITITLQPPMPFLPFSKYTNVNRIVKPHSLGWLFSLLNEEYVEIDENTSVILVGSKQRATTVDFSSNFWLY